MKYKKSNYNIIAVKDGKNYLWNTLSGAVAIMDDELMQYFSSDAMDINLCKDFDKLRENRFVVPEDFNEYSFVLTRAEKLIHNKEPENLFFVIAPTLKCNYHCQYCFENQRQSFASMSEKIMADTENYITKIVDSSNTLKRLNITWFGGEPLLCIDEIEKMGLYFLRLCEKHNMEYRASLITNGRFLDQHAVDVLLKTNIKKLQISFDGTESVYCHTKQASYEDYRMVLSNIQKAAQCGLPVLIRINIRDNDFSQAYQVADLLLGEMKISETIKLYPAFVNEGLPEGRAELYKEFVKQEAKFAEYIFEKYTADNYFNKLAVSHGIACSLSCNNNVCIGPEGELYKCEHHFGQSDYIVGNISEDTTSPFMDMYSLVTEESLHKDKCKSCPVFPVCMGGCPNSSLLNEQNFDCSSFISYLIQRQIRIN